MEEFNNCINSCGLVDWKLEGKQLSWCNGQYGLARSWVKLDRVLVNNAFTSKFNGAIAHLLSRRTSDHSSILLQFETSFSRYGPPPFQFQNMWTSHENFLKVVESQKVDISDERGLHILARKLK
ncbi:hypothetical protein I3760_04G163600 [Carya illinoinensis]|nr:hypothetical protein I3760_04G163600 [Carya illinoinensis]